MSVQKQVPLTGIIPQCVCGKPGKAYATDGTQFHMECHPCSVFTVKLSSLYAAKAEFIRVVRVKQADLNSQKYMLQGVSRES